MFKNLDELMSIIVDSQDIVIDDRLSLLIERYRDDELTEENLDFISAASMPNYNKFLEKYINEWDNKRFFKIGGLVCLIWILPFILM